MRRVPASRSLSFFRRLRGEFTSPLPPSMGFPRLGWLLAWGTPRPQWPSGGHFVSTKRLLFSEPSVSPRRNTHRRGLGAQGHHQEIEKSNLGFLHPSQLIARFGTKMELLRGSGERTTRFICYLQYFAAFGEPRVSQGIPQGNPKDRQEPERDPPRDPRGPQGRDGVPKDREYSNLGFLHPLSAHSSILDQSGAITWEW